jgi:Zn-dependent protease
VDRPWVLTVCRSSGPVPKNKGLTLAVTRVSRLAREIRVPGARCWRASSAGYKYGVEQYPEGLRDYDPVHPRGTDWRRLLRRIWGPIAVVLGLILKFGFAVFKFFSIFISVAAYALIWGWRFATGFVLLILVHEMGHFLEARRQGLDASLPTFIPFIGAYVLIKNAPLNPWRNALVALAGPALGGAGAALCWGLGESMDSDLLRALAFAGFLINLINLIPIGILDGGAVWHAIQVARHTVAPPPGQDFPSGSTHPIALPGGGRDRATQIAVLYGILVSLLVIGMVVAHVPQQRL